MKKKAITTLFTSLLVVSLCACGKNETNENAGNVTPSTSNKTGVIMTIPDYDAPDKEIIETVPKVEEPEEVKEEAPTETAETPETTETTETTETAETAETVTAASLIDNLNNLNVQYIDGSCKLVMDISDKSSNVKMTLDMDIESNKKWTHSNTSTSMSGQTVKVETWMNNKTGDCYSLVAGVNGWQKTKAANVTDYTDLSSKVTSDICKELEFSNITNDYYEVTAIIPAESAANLLGSNSSAMTSSVDLSKITYKAFYRFDKETQQLQYVKINIVIDPDIQRKDGIEINKYYIEFNYDEISLEEKELTPPSFN